jgi:hypothetical protein
VATYREERISAALKLAASWLKQAKNCYLNTPIIIFCQKVKKMVILMVKNLSSAEYGAKGLLRA